MPYKSMYTLASQHKINLWCKKKHVEKKKKHKCWVRPKFYRRMSSIQATMLSWPSPYLSTHTYTLLLTSLYWASQSPVSFNLPRLSTPGELLSNSFNNFEFLEMLFQHSIFLIKTYTLPLFDFFTLCFHTKRALRMSLSFSSILFLFTIVLIFRSTSTSLHHLSIHRAPRQAFSACSSFSSYS